MIKFRTTKEAEVQNKKLQTNETLTTALPSEQLDEKFYILIYSGMIIVLFVLAFMRAMTFFVICMRSSIKLHNTMFSKILRAPIYMFDVNPVGKLTILTFKLNFDQIFQGEF